MKYEQWLIIIWMMVSYLLGVLSTLLVNYPALTNGASWFVEGHWYTVSPQALIRAVPALLNYFYKSLPFIPYLTEGDFPADRLK